MHPLIDAARQEKAKRYEKAKTLYGAVEVAVAALYTGGLHFAGVSVRVAAFASRWPPPAALPLYALCFVPLWIALFPLAFFKGYALDKEFGLSTQSVKAWLLDRLKGFLLSAAFGYLLLLLLFFLFRATPVSWWVFAALGLAAVQVVVAFVFPVILLPLFFRQTPIEDEGLRNAVAGLLKRAGIGISGVYSFNMSAKSTRGNAALAGIWKTRRILIADTLLAGMPGAGRDRPERGRGYPDAGQGRPGAGPGRDEPHVVDKVLAVAAHEAGHHAGKHMLQLFLLGFAVTCATLFVLHRVMGLFDGFPADFPRTLSLMPLMALAAGAVSFPLGIATNAFARAKEREADERALALTGDPGAFIMLMADLANTNLADAYPKKIRILLSFTHPPIGERITAAEEWKGRRTDVPAPRCAAHRQGRLP